MNYRKISVVALSNRDFPSFAAKIEEAIRWVEYASLQGAQLVVLPEMLNLYKGDGPGNPEAMSLAEAALENWENEIAPLREAAVRFNTAITVPLLIRENGSLANVFFLLSKGGEILGRFQKLHPTPDEVRTGVMPGKPTVIDWEGVPVSGAICFDTNYIDTFESQAELGAKLFLIPSLWNGGPWLPGFAARLAIPMAVSYSAWSRIIDVDGTTLIAGGYRQETLRFGFGAPVFTAEINFDREVFHLNGQCENVIEMQRRYGNKVRVALLHEQGAFLVESVTDSLSIAEVKNDYQLIPFRNYLSQAR